MADRQGNQTAPRVSAICAVVALAVVTFLPSLANGFVFDDVHIVVEQNALHSLENFKEIITTPWWSNALYRPLTKLSLAVDWVVGGGQAWYFHLVNVMLHAVAAVLVYGVAVRWIGIFGATIAACVFSVHPVHVEAVASVVGRAEVLATIFACGTVLLYRWDGVLSYYGDVSWRRYVSALGTITSLILGLASKESAFVIPGLLLFVDWMESRLRNDSFESRFRAHWLVWVGCVVLSLEWLWLRSEILGGLVGDVAAPGLEGAGLLGRALVMAPMVLQYFRLLVFPVQLSADYSPDFVTVSQSMSWSGVAGLSVLVVVTAVAVGMRRRAPLLTFSVLWIAAALLIVSNLVVPTGVLLAERTLYLPSVGLALIVGYVVSETQLSSRSWVPAVIGVVVGLGLIRSAHRIPVFRNDATFYPQLVADAPGSFRGWWISGNLAYIDGDRTRGEQQLRRALVTYPLFPNVWQDFGRHLQEDQRWVEAANAFAAAFRLDTNRVYDAANAVTNYLRVGLADSARRYAELAAQVEPFHPRVKGALGDIAAAEGNLMHAMTLHRQAAWLNPDQPVYWFRAARAAIAAEYCPTSIEAVSMIARLDASFAELEALRQEVANLGCATR